MRKHSKNGDVLDTARTILYSILAAFLVSMVFILALGVNPLSAFAAMSAGVFGRAYGLAETVAKATPLIIIGLGITIASRGGLANLGGDGQYYMGALSSICVGLFLPKGTSPMIVWVLAFMAAVLFGAFWGGLAGFLKARFHTSEVIITIMLNYVALYLVGALVNGALQAPGGIPQTRALDKAYQFVKLIPGTRVHAGILIGLVLALLVWLLFKKTTLGYRIQTVGESPRAAQYGGINVKRYEVIIMGLAGAAAGIAGMVDVYGVHFRVLEGITNGFGFTALLIALLARLNPLAVVLGSLFISALTVGANAMQIQMNVPTSIVNVVQSLIIFFMLILPGIRKRRLSRRKHGGGLAVAAPADPQTTVVG
ncbi:MAG: ABC transporter permease [Eubacteriales bacterium]|nr:ABC transporter permease [Eubacteriales bacterium]